MSALAIDVEQADELDRVRRELGALVVLLGQADSIADRALDGLASLLTRHADALDAIHASLSRDQAGNRTQPTEHGA